MPDDVLLATGRVQRRRIVVRGVVQGVGFRPFVAKVAAELQLTGHCGNDVSSVFIEAEGQPEALDELIRRIHAEPPAMAVVEDVSDERLAPGGDGAFTIVPSRTQAGVRTLVSPDVGTCSDCLAELCDPADRRYRHPFITCTNCGPRFTIIRDLPYDRPATTMAGFEMCARCAQEYADPGDRRYHAQPIACHDCGPRLWIEGASERPTSDDSVVEQAQRLLRDGAILAVKGVGGFHLACDATNAKAVATLRERKHRPDKPLAVMARDLATVRRFAAVSPVEAAALSQPARPIALLRELPANPLAEGVAPGLDEIGVMLAYTPLHHLLLQPAGLAGAPEVLVMTSGNLSDEPLCYRNDDARVRLAGIADAFVMHDRDIAVPCDDSVVAIVDDGELPVRRSRGYAPLPVRLGTGGPVTLAVGGELKNTFCLSRDETAFCSGHLGDMGSLETLQAFEVAIRQMTALHAVEPELLVADAHPGYATHAWAERYRTEHGVPLVTVQHHHAHVASLLAEHGLLGTPAIGVAFDGTGYGCDRSVWGGELLLMGPTVSTATRVGHLEAFTLAGGDRAVRKPFRVAVALLQASGVADIDCLDLTSACPAEELAVVLAQLASGVGCVQTTSMGRLFDGVASLLGVRHQVSYEAQAAIELEALARTSRDPASLIMDVGKGELRFGELVRGVIDGLRSGRSPADLARGFHRALASATMRLVVVTAAEHGVDTVGLTGGVFQNRLLLEDLAAELRAAGLRVLTHRRVPPNDGGLSLGQAAVGRAMVAEGLATPTRSTGGAT